MRSPPFTHSPCINFKMSAHKLKHPENDFEGQLKEYSEKHRKMRLAAGQSVLAGNEKSGGVCGAGGAGGPGGAGGAGGAGGTAAESKKRKIDKVDLTISDVENDNAIVIDSDEENQDDSEPHRRTFP